MFILFQDCYTIMVVVHIAIQAKYCSKSDTTMVPSCDVICWLRTSNTLIVHNDLILDLKAVEMSICCLNIQTLSQQSLPINLELSIDHTDLLYCKTVYFACFFIYVNIWFYLTRELN